MDAKLTAEALGLSQDEIMDRVVERVADRLLGRTFGYDEDGQVDPESPTLIKRLGCSTSSRSR